jgi:23S rRNA (adenine2503-C2)-methyltransferase
MKDHSFILGTPRKQLEEFFFSENEKVFHAKQVLQWLHEYGETDFSKMTNISKSLRKKLSEKFTLNIPSIVSTNKSIDGTVKWLLRLYDGSLIETVFIPEKDRGTLCISSQAGCSLDCSFCSTAQHGFVRNLTSDEIISQIWLVRNNIFSHEDDKNVSNIVFMGMGEPLANFNHLVDVLDLLLDDSAYGFSKRRVTVSTSGLAPRIKQLSNLVDVSLAVSLHAPNNELRNVLVPINKRYPIEELLEACRFFLKHKKRKSTITFEYVMLDKVNDTVALAKELSALLRDFPCKINLIPFNDFPNSQYQCSSTQQIDLFSKILHDAGIVTTVRKSRGTDIAAACGQLAGHKGAIKISEH